jgi:hypothetical protein
VTCYAGNDDIQRSLLWASFHDLNLQQPRSLRTRTTHTLLHAPGGCGGGSGGDEEKRIRRRCFNPAEWAQNAFRDSCAAQSSRAGCLRAKRSRHSWRAALLRAGCDDQVEDAVLIPRSGLKMPSAIHAQRRVVVLVACERREVGTRGGQRFCARGVMFRLRTLF